jgi:hypothetical protein
MVFNDRLPVDTRMYGGIESTRGLTVQLLGPDGRPRASLNRDPGYERTAFTEALSGPFAGYSVRVAANSNAPVVWADRFVILLAVFIAPMSVMLIGATFGPPRAVPSRPTQVELSRTLARAQDADRADPSRGRDWRWRFPRPRTSRGSSAASAARRCG